MKRILLLVAVVVPVLAAAVYSRQQPAAGTADAAERPSELKIATAEKNPWTDLKLNNDPDQFQFAVVSDRTGGHRAKVFSRAVHQINLLQPEFVMSVGDLIEGYTQKQDVIDAEWDEFDGYVKKFQMPFFYVPGNHDLANKEHGRGLGRAVRPQLLPLRLQERAVPGVNSEDGAASTDLRGAERVLQEGAGREPERPVDAGVPAQAALDRPGPGEERLGGGREGRSPGRKYTVFCGHVHRYQKFVRNGMNYYQLATTGGGSRLRGVEYGEFDHVAWMTMKKDGPLIANVMLDGILPGEPEVPDTDEPAVERRGSRSRPTRSGGR